MVMKVLPYLIYKIMTWCEENRNRPADAPKIKEFLVIH